MDKDRTRGERRDRDRRHSERARRTEHRFIHQRSWYPCTCPIALGRYRKRKALSCRCRGKQPGTPKLAGSLHKSSGYKYRESTMRRIWNHRLAHTWLSYTGATDLDDVELASGPIAGRRRNTRSW